LKLNIGCVILALVIGLTEVIFIYILVISLVAVFITVSDKKKAIKGKRRISEKNLLLTAFFGGAATMYTTMLLIRHKTKHIKFMLLLPLMIILHFLLLYLILKFI